MKGVTVILILHRKNQYRKTLPKISVLNTYILIILEFSSMFSNVLRLRLPEEQILALLFLCIIKNVTDSRKKDQSMFLIETYNILLR